ncbi:MAG TPA: hypothetical protein VG754_11700, partial [Verrucomicrobiae bacterium]|nr:hypothetical protein [Verrucomicrobiae bacterium]
MHRNIFRFIIASFAFVAAGTLFAAERSWDFTEMTVDQPPKNCFSTVAGEGKPGTWKILMDEFPLAMQPLSSSAPKTVQ